MKKNNKRGFTLVELLAVIVILAVILVIAIPQIMNTIKQARLSSIRDSAILIATSAEKDYLSEQILNKDYSVTSIPCTDVAKLSDDYASCTIKYNNGVATVKLKGSANGKFANIQCSGTKDNMTCGEKKEKACTAEGTLAQGLEYVDGQYTYRYKQQSDYYGTWENMSDDGWGVMLTDKDSTDPVTTELCYTINGKYITSMGVMFYDSKATSLDLNSFDTSNVTTMIAMFSNSAATAIDLSSFDTSKVTSMQHMFAGSTATSLDLSSFDTSKVTNMGSMFQGSVATSIDLSSFDTSKVTNMGSMFIGSAATSLDLSSFDTSNATNMSGMFAGAAATTVYARNNDEITRLSTGTNKPSTMNIVLKS